MKIKELIQELSELHPELDVKIVIEGDYGTDDDDIEQVKALSEVVYISNILPKDKK